MTSALLCEEEVGSFAVGVGAGLHLIKWSPAPGEHDFSVGILTPMGVSALYYPSGEFTPRPYPLRVGLPRVHVQTVAPWALPRPAEPNALNSFPASFLIYFLKRRFYRFIFRERGREREREGEKH